MILNKRLSPQKNKTILYRSNSLNYIKEDNNDNKVNNNNKSCNSSSNNNNTTNFSLDNS